LAWRAASSSISRSIRLSRSLRVTDGRIAEAKTAVGITLTSAPTLARTSLVSSRTSLRDSAIRWSTAIGAPKVTIARER
jgi:hypothetical protein